MTLVTVTTVSTYTNLVIPPNNEGLVVPHEYALNANLTQVPVVDKAGSRVPDLLPGHTYPLEGNPLITTGPTLVNTTEEINRHLESTEDEVSSTCWITYGFWNLWKFFLERNCFRACPPLSSPNTGYYGPEQNRYDVVVLFIADQI